MIKPDHYSYRVIWSKEDGEYVGLCDEFSSLSWLAQTEMAALEGIVIAVGDILEDMVYCTSL